MKVAEKLFHVVDMRYVNNKTRGKVHYTALTGKGTMCGKQATSIKVGDEPIDLLRRVKQPVDCVSCIKALEMELRIELGQLNHHQLETIADIIWGMRNGDKV